MSAIPASPPYNVPVMNFDGHSTGLPGCITWAGSARPASIVSCTPKSWKCTGIIIKWPPVLVGPDSAKSVESEQKTIDWLKEEKDICPVIPAFYALRLKQYQEHFPDKWKPDPAGN